MDRPKMYEDMPRGEAEVYMLYSYDLDKYADHLEVERDRYKAALENISKATHVQTKQIDLEDMRRIASRALEEKSE